MSIRYAILCIIFTAKHSEMTKSTSLFSLMVFILLSVSCSNQQENTTTTSSYFDYSEKDDLLSGGVKMIPIQTASGEFKVWTKRVGNNPTMKLLLLHGGPGMTHEYFEAFDSYFPNAEIEYYYYDQLESAYSDQPNDSSLWSVKRYVDEVEQVRKALGLDKSNFYLLGHSWGGILAMEYALKYQENLKGLIISNMVASVPEYNKYADEVLGPQLPPEVLTEIKNLEAKGEYTSPRYTELLFEYFYTEHVLRMPLAEWPEPANRSFGKLNPNLYIAMQGPSEFGIVGDAKLKNWDVSKELVKIKTPTLTIGGNFDTMDPKYMEWMSTQVQNGQYLNCPKGSHMSMYDDQETYFKGLINFIKEVDKKKE
jgi:proline iminopeptidase